MEISVGHSCAQCPAPSTVAHQMLFCGCRDQGLERPGRKLNPCPPPKLALTPQVWGHRLSKGPLMAPHSFLHPETLLTHPPVARAWRNGAAALPAGLLSPPAHRAVGTGAVSALDVAALH